MGKKQRLRWGEYGLSYIGFARHSRNSLCPLSFFSLLAFDFFAYGFGQTTKIMFGKVWLLVSQLATLLKMTFLYPSSIHCNCCLDGHYSKRRNIILYKSIYILIAEHSRIHVGWRESEQWTQELHDTGIEGCKTNVQDAWLWSSYGSLHPRS